MRTIMFINGKGGCGKSTLSTNLASLLSNRGDRVGIIDLDPQGSSTGWLQNRPALVAPIAGLNDTNLSQYQDSYDYLILDVASGVGGVELELLLRRTDLCIIPVLPSPHDIHAVGFFLRDVIHSEAVKQGHCQAAVVANRVKLNTVAYQSLDHFLSRVSIPFVATFRESQNYVRTAAHGLGIADTPRAKSTTDAEDWNKLLRWITRNSKDQRQAQAS